MGGGGWGGEWGGDIVLDIILDGKQLPQLSVYQI